MYANDIAFVGRAELKKESAIMGLTIKEGKTKKARW